MTGGGTATPEPLDLSEITRSGDLFDALATRRVSIDPGSGSTVPDDPAARLLAALVADVDTGAPPLPTPAPARVPCTGAKTSGRPVVRAFVTFSAVAVMLTTAGAAVAGGGGDGGPRSHAPSAKSKITERSKARIQTIVRALPSGPRPTPAAGTASPAPSPSKASGAHAPAKEERGSGLAGRPANRPVTPGGRPTGGPSPTPTPTPSPGTGAPTGSPSPVSTPSATPRPSGSTTRPDRPRRRAASSNTDTNTDTNTDANTGTLRQRRGDHR
ncbi:hypothetical protein NE235_20495 [Actinoallomurus spadix]|uniref:Uncharacterized protein n=1 Tax=Actinoallomurus spadix TaxID=79912 RepID=A0ABP3G1L2_9ACTN|nr:hypothetical protein [Actinoallomurus spadix]MCO5988488.1 hypothetical protein [Actinoallomurus spadix]